MKILECYIENFGKLSDKKFEFSNGFNSITAENGYGKTTLSVFIKCMLYGMSDTKKTSLDENERKRYLPWSGAVAGGSLTFSAKDKIYRIERIFGVKPAEDRFSLYDTSLGKESSDFSENLGEELFGVDAESFERTLFLSEKNLSPKNDNKSISAKLSELVGCDGDISSMDRALKLLEDQRKIYAKKGGSGEIADIRIELSNLNEKITEIDGCETRIKETQDRLADLVIKEQNLREEEHGIVKERETLVKRTNDRSYKQTLSDMRGRLSVSETRRADLINFFRGSIPSFAEIDNAKSAESELKRLRSIVDEKEDSEFSYLQKYFENKATPSRIEEIREALLRYKNNSYEDSPITKRKKELFEKRTPSAEEVEAEIKRQKNLSKKPILATLLIILGALVSIAGIVLGAFIEPMLSLTALVGAAVIVTVLIFVNTKINIGKKKLKLFLLSLSNSLPFDTRQPLMILEEIKELISKEENVPDPKERDRAVLDHFVFLFDKGTDTLSAADEILEKYDKLKELTAIERYKAQTREKSKYDIVRLETELKRFTERFNCKTRDPIEEVRAALNEYNRLSADIVDRNKDIESLTSNHRIEEDNLQPIRTSSELDTRSYELTSLFSDISRERALLDRQYREDCEKLETREELLSKKSELEEKLENYTENLEIIKLTKKYLEDARDSMTTKYLGKTKSAFEKYVKSVSGESGEYEMDTSFGISRLEGAKTHITEAYSRGMRDVYNLAARFALIDSLYENETPFVILDDPFTALDDNKCNAALDLLKDFSKERQIIYFTCSNSRA